MSDLNPQSPASAFTLIEVLLALAISAIVLAGIGGVFFSAMRLRERTVAMLEEAAPLQQALTFLRRDLQGVLPPGGVMASDFKYGALNNGVGQGFGLQFSTTTGLVREEVPWGDVQQVTYELRDPVVRSNGVFGKELFRLITRNLLPTTTTMEAEEQFLLGNVENLEVSCFDGLQWRESWDTSLSDTNLPTAVRVRIQLAGESLGDQRNRQPVELIVPVVVQAYDTTNQTDTATEGGGG
ncbi:MAG TPA: type II secretion system protein GspJ [Candidatus Sulfotelmatobacter sp.]|nr:type II secretion system protein GspJ [Candidatus Sulfotelmatobacter sp.]